MFDSRNVIHAIEGSLDSHILQRAQMKHNRILSEKLPELPKIRVRKNFEIRKDLLGSLNFFPIRPSASSAALFFETSTVFTSVKALLGGHCALKALPLGLPPSQSGSSRA
jgi:flagellar motor switch protein FliM